MAERQFRFRLPWLSAATAPRPTSEPQPPRPTVETQAPAQPAANIPIQRPPLRPARIAPPQPRPSQASAPPRTGPQRPSPPRTTTESQITASQPASPARGRTQTRATSLPPSPSRSATEPRVASQPASPSRGTTQTSPAPQPDSPSRAVPQSRASSVPPSPSQIASEAQRTEPIAAQARSLPPSAIQTSSQPPSLTASEVRPAISLSSFPPEKSQPAAEDTSQQEEPRSISSSPPLEEPQPKTEVLSKLQDQEQPSQASGPGTEDTQTSTRAVLTPAASQESGAKETADDGAHKVAEDLKREDKKSDPSDEGPMKKQIEKLLAAGSDSGAKAKRLIIDRIHEQRQQKEEVNGRKKTAFISHSSEQIKAVSSIHPEAGSNFSESHRKPLTPNKEQVPLHKEIRDDISKFVHSLGLGTGESKPPLDGMPFGVLTLAGDNKGAFMHLGSEASKKDSSIHIHRGYRFNPDESTEASTDGEEKLEARRFRNPSAIEEPATKAYINSNTQSINNSLVLQSSINEGNPGAKLIISHTVPERTKPSAKPEPLETHKAEYNVTRAEKLTYEPTVRRRCLRGLFLEPSDSEPDNPEKPRRHGCRYSCGDKCKDKDIGVF